MKKTLTLGLLCSAVFTLPAMAAPVPVPQCGPQASADEYCQVSGENQVTSERIELGAARPDDDVVVTRFTYEAKQPTFEEMLESSRN